MKKIAISIENENLIFKYRTKGIVEPNLLNTNVVSDNKLIFSDEYIIQNRNIVSLFIVDLINDYNIKNVVISNNELAYLIVDLFNEETLFDCLYLKDDETLSYNLCEKIAHLKSIKKVSCYEAPVFMMELLDKNNIGVESRNEVLFTSNFMLNNNLSSYSDIYYKKSITVGEVLTEDDFTDFGTFCELNKYLKVIHVDIFRQDNLERLIEILVLKGRRNIVIQIHEDINEEKEIMYLKSKNKELKVKYKLKLELAYSKDYLEKNYFKQIIFTTLKLCSVIIFVIIGSIMSYIFYNNYQSLRKVNAITEDLKALMVEDIDGDATDIDTDPIEDIEDGNNDGSSEDTTDNKSDIKYVNSYDKLLSVNNETVGWLTVLGTNIDYPVVQTDNNDYYLEKNFYKEKDYNGWVFMDFRNNVRTLDDNTIIYAHNRYYSGVMFGTLNKVTNANWRNDPTNLYITFNTLYKKMKWKVFSIYSINVTNDYLYTNFNLQSEHQEFIDLIKNRSDYSFDTEVGTDDKILTLSTCLDNNKRLVVHAVLQD